MTVDLTKRTLPLVLLLMATILTPALSGAATVAPYIGRRIADVIEGAGDSGSITGQ